MASFPLQIRLLGQWDLRYADGTPVPLDSARAESLLAYLLLHREAPQPRQQLAFLLWPDSDEPQARTNLRHLLHTLRRALPDADRFVEITPRTLQWRADAPALLDLAAFTDVLARAARDPGELQAAVDLYAGDLLAGVYDDWLLIERETLRTSYLDALTRLAARYEAVGEMTRAIDWAARLLREEPLREET